MENAVNVNSWGVMAREDYVLRGGNTHRALPCGWETERHGCESPGVCPDVDVGNFQHQGDSTSEVTSFHLKWESEKAGRPLCVEVGGGS